jgi:hypothetical protein
MKYKIDYKYTLLVVTDYFLTNKMGRKRITGSGTSNLEVRKQYKKRRVDHFNLHN